MIKLKIITIILIAVSLSMDAFSLSLIYGTQGITKKHKIILSLIVGAYHFIMPLLGVTIGKILILISIEMIISSFKKEEKSFLLTIPSYLIFGLSVSIDSLTTGIGLSLITNKYVISSLIFAITSLSFTYLGVNIGDKLNQKYGKMSTIIGGTILLLLGILYALGDI